MVTDVNDNGVQVSPPVAPPPVATIGSTNENRCFFNACVRVVFCFGRYRDWGPEAATAFYQDLVAAGKGLLEKITPGDAVRGMENGGNTCYIDRYGTPPPPLPRDYVPPIVLHGSDFRR